VKGLVYISEFERYVSGSLAAGAAANVGQVVSNLPQNRGVPRSSRLGVGADKPNRTKRLTVKNLKLC